MERFTVKASVYDPEANTSATLFIIVYASNEEHAEHKAWELLDHIPANIEIDDIYPTTGA